MNKNFQKLTTAIFIFLILPFSVFAQDDKDAAFLFAYTPKEGQTEAFNEGYKAHLNWHKENGDTLPWFAWYVIFGENLGQFIDGTFGISFKDFDERVIPGEDALDFAKTAGPHARADYRKAMILRRDLSSQTPLENLNPSPMVHVTYFSINTGFKTNFENVIKEINPKLGVEVSHSWYEMKVGGLETTFMLMTAIDSFEDIGSSSNIKAILERDYPNSLAPLIGKVRSEVWMYREDLSLLPGD